MKPLLLFLCSLGLLMALEREGNYKIEFEPIATLQSGVQIPFEVRVWDANHRPIRDAKVTMALALVDGTRPGTVKAIMTDPGLYIAKPVFAVPGQWNVEVTVRRNDEFSTHATQFNIQE